MSRSSAVIDQSGKWAPAEEILEGAGSQQVPSSSNEPEPTNTANGSVPPAIPARPFIPPPPPPPPPVLKPSSNPPATASSIPLIPVRRASQGPTQPQPSSGTSSAPRVASSSAPHTPQYPSRQEYYGSTAPAPYIGGPTSYPSQPYQLASSSAPQIFASPAPMSTYGSPATTPYQSPAPPGGPATPHSQRPATIPHTPYGTPSATQPIPPRSQRPATTPSAPQTPGSQSMYGAYPPPPQRTPGSQSMYGTSPAYPSSARPVSYGAPITPGAPRVPYSNLPPGVVIVGPKASARKKTDAFVANDPFRSHSHSHSKHERASDDLTFDDIPVAGATVVSQPYNRPPWGSAPPPVSSYPPATVTPGHQSQPQPPSSVTWRPNPSPYDPSNPPVMSQQPQPIYSRPSSAYDASSPYPVGPYPIGDTSGRTSSPGPTSQPPMQLPPSTVDSTGPPPPPSSSDHHQQPVLQPPEPMVVDVDQGPAPSPRQDDGDRPPPQSPPPSPPPDVDYPPPRPGYPVYDPTDPTTFPQQYSPRIPIFEYDPPNFPSPPPRPPFDYDMYPIPKPKQSIWSRVWPFSRRNRLDLENPYNYNNMPAWRPPSSFEESKLGYPTIATIFIVKTLPRQIYLHFLLRLPSLYFSRVARIFEEADLTLPEIKKMALQTAAGAQGKNTNTTNAGFDIQSLERDNVPPEYERLKGTWEGFIDSVMREWKTFNIISVLLLSAILTILQIQGAADDPLTRTFAIFSLICALISLLFGCMYIIRFGSMRKTYKAAEWALEAKKSKTVIWWNVWVLLAMPVVWLTWSIMLYIACIMSFVWRTSASDTTPPADLSEGALLAVRIIITTVLGLGMIYGWLILSTFSRYGEAMDRAWKERIDGWLEEKEFLLQQQQPPPLGPYGTPTYFDPATSAQMQQPPPSSQYPGYSGDVSDYRPTAPVYSSSYPNYPPYAGAYPPPDTKLGYTGPDYGPTYANAGYMPPPEPYDSPAQSPRTGSPQSTSSTLYATRVNTEYNKTPGLELQREGSGSSGVYGYGVGVGAQQPLVPPPPPPPPIPEGGGAYGSGMPMPPPRLVPQKIPLAVPPGPDLPPIPGTPMTGFTNRSSGGGSLRERDVEDGDNDNVNPAGPSSTTTRKPRDDTEDDDLETHVRFRSPLISAQGSFSFAGSDREQDREAEEPLLSASTAGGGGGGAAEVEASGSSFNSFNTARVSPVSSERGDESLRRRRLG